MSEALLKAILNILLKLASEKFLSRAIIEIAREVALRTESEVDDRIVRAMADALGVPYPEMKRMVISKGPLPANIAGKLV